MVSPVAGEVFSGCLQNISLTRKGLKIKLGHEVCGVAPMAQDSIEQLEAKINRLIERHERTKREKENIEKKLQQKESEWHHLKGQIRQYERERVELREKLDKIIGHFGTLDLPE
jgi:predicted nuclease with TOPRIM domain